MVRELKLASFCKCCSCGRNAMMVVRPRCIPAMVISVRFSMCMGMVVGETFFGDAATGVNGGSFIDFIDSGWMLVSIHFFIFLSHIMPRLISKLQ